MITILPLTEIGKGKLTVGKIYGGLLLLENWKQSKFGSSPLPKVKLHTTTKFSPEGSVEIFSIGTYFVDMFRD